MKSKTAILLFCFLLFFSCKNYYNEMIEWSDSIPRGASIDSVKQIQPDFIEIDWNNPLEGDGETRYIITKIRNNHDVLKMENYLVFVNNQYQGRFAQK